MHYQTLISGNKIPTALVWHLARGQTPTACNQCCTGQLALQ